MANKNKVNLFDPNESISDLKNVLGSIRTEDLNIYVELTANRKGRGSKFTSTTIENDTEQFSVNLLGNNTKTNNFTTNWTNSSPDSSSEYEGFGIQDIKIITDSSLLPRVTIEFVDIHGLSFFSNDKSSPYKVLFDFPPPIFTLTVKGYYGKALKYELHLTKTDAKFNPSTGNYHITSDFVARTFAPLTDVLYKYIEIFPLMTIGDVSNNDPNSVPSNTRELLTRIRSLYDIIGKTTKTSISNKKAKESSEAVRNIGLFLTSIINFNKSSEFNDYSDKENLKKFNLISVYREQLEKDTEYEMGEYTFDEYRKYLKSLSSDNSSPYIKKRFLIGVENTDDSKNDEKIDALTKFSNKMLKDASLNIPTLTFKEKLNKAEDSDISGINDHIFEEKNYSFIDISYILQKTYKEYNKRIEIFETNNKNFKDEINRLPKEILKFEPTIYNIFKILCDDIDTFFKVMKSTVKAANTHREQFSAQLLNQRDKIVGGETISAFPLVHDLDEKSVVKNRESRVFPIKLSNSIVGNPFPEVLLVDKFLDKYVDVLKDEEILNLKSKLDENENNIWLPISPVDSELYQRNVSLNSPYAEFLKTNDGENESLDNLYNVLLNRYYLISQYVQPNRFSDKKNRFIVDYYASAEAANIANSSMTKNILLALQTESKSNVDQFYSKLESLKSGLYNNISDNTKITIKNNIDINLDKTSENFIGSTFIEPEYIVVKNVNSTDNNDDPVEKFLTESIDKEGNWFKKFFKAKDIRKNKQLTKENILYYVDNSKDVEDQNSNDDFNNSYYFLTFNGYNKSIFLEMNSRDGTSKGSWGKIIENKSYSDEIVNLINYSGGDVLVNKQAITILYLSMFGRIMTPYEHGTMTDSTIVDSRGILNALKNPGLHEIPIAYIIYVGGLLYTYDNLTIYDRIVEIKTIFDRIINEGEQLFSDAALNKIKYNIDELNRYISESDKKMYIQMFTDFVIEDSQNTSTKSFTKSYTSYMRSLESDIEKYNNHLETDDKSIDVEYLASMLNNSDFLKIGNKKIGLMVNTSLAYDTVLTNSNTAYVPLGSRSGDSAIVDRYFFEKFLSKLDNYLDGRIEYVNDVENEYLGKVDNLDIKNRVYYSFKNIADKWLVNDNTDGFPSMDGALIDNFKFVDRAMNDIGGAIGKGCVIDIEQIIDLSKNYDINMMSLFSTVLSHNNFEFFPIQNFMEHSSNQWNNNSFGIFPNSTLAVQTSPAFVCMYIGGMSNVLNDPDGLYRTDGIESLENMGADFIGDNEDIESNVNAFKVSYGKQNQSIFTGVDVDSREYPETNESLQILSKLAGDESSSSPTPMGQNLFNMYQERSYSSTITMMGNMMIQPTHYYQIEHIPLFNGAYEILKVEHHISPNHMVTKFNGIKVGKYPNPIVSEFSTSIGIQGGTSDFDTIYGSDSKEDIGNRIVPPSSILDEVNYDSMHKLKIS